MQAPELRCCALFPSSASPRIFEGIPNGHPRPFGRGILYAAGGFLLSHTTTPRARFPVLFLRQSCLLFHIRTPPPIYFAPYFPLLPLLEISNSIPNGHPQPFTPQPRPPPTCHFMGFNSERTAPA